MSLGEQLTRLGLHWKAGQLIADAIGLRALTSSFDFTAWNPTPTGFSAVPSGAVYRYIQIGKWVRIVVSMQNNGTSNATTFTIPLPVTAANISGLSWQAPILAFDNTSTRTCGLASIDPAATAVALYTTYMGAGWTNSGGKRAYFQMDYEAA